MMKIYHVTLRNKDYAGEVEIEYTVIANNIADAQKKGQTLLRKNDKTGRGMGRWEVVKVELAEITDN